MFLGKPQFFGVRAAAANLGGGDKGTYTLEQFRQDYPQFFNAEGYFLGSLPMLEQIITMANASIQPSKWGDLWRYAVGLFVAHYATLSLRTYAPSSDNAQQAAASGAIVGIPKSATLGDASVSYDTNAVTAGTEDWGDLNSTQYGQILASKARLIGIGGSYII